MSAGTIAAILVASNKGEPQHAHEQAELRAGVGLVGDRHAGGGIVSLIEREAVEAFNAATGLTVEEADVRRNIVTTGIRLNPLVGQRFRVGDVELEGTELCEPCASLGQALQTPEVPAKDVVRHFVASAGIRARVLTTAVITPGTEIVA